MDPQRWTRIESLYHAALEKGPEERAGYLAEACVDEPELKREFESLLACADAELKNPLATGERWLSGFHVGSYEIIEALGAGGMGEVSRARDTRLLREVAINFLPCAFLNDLPSLAAFEREAQDPPISAIVNWPPLLSDHRLFRRR